MNSVKAIFLVLFSLFSCLNVLALHTDRFLKFSSALIPLDSSHVEKRNKKGNILKIESSKTYAVGDYEYEFYSGKHTYFYANGDKLYEYLFDDYGSPLSFKHFDQDGQLISESRTTKVDTEANSLKEFVSNDKKTTITTIFSKYSCSKNCDWFLKKQGKKINGKKVGLWKTFSEDGQVLKEKDYSKIK